MGADQERLSRLWKYKRAEAPPLDPGSDLLAQLDDITKYLHRRMYESASGHKVQDVRRPIRHPIHKWMKADVDGRVRDTGAIFFTQFLPTGNFSETDLATAQMARPQHLMWVTAARWALFSIITGDGKWFSMTVAADPLYQHLLLTAEKKFLRCVQTGEPPPIFGIETPTVKLQNQADRHLHLKQRAASVP
jgi:hypothetical protein